MTREAMAAGLLADLRVRAEGAKVLDDLPEPCRPADLDAAYRVQAALRALLAGRGSGPQAGWKIGCTTAVMQEYLNIPHPCAGTLYRATVFEREARVAAADFFTLGLECEITVRLSADLPGTGHDRTSVAGAVGGVMASIEIVEHRFRDFSAAAVESLVADDFFSWGCVVGDAVTPGMLPDLGTLHGGFSVNGAAPVTTGDGSAILGHPLAALAWLANHAGALGTSLVAGQVVTLGSVVKTVYPGPGETVVAQFDGLPPAVIVVT